MNLRCLCILFIALSGHIFPATASDVFTNVYERVLFDGQELLQATPKRWEGGSLVVFHSRGVTRIPKARLPNEFQVLLVDPPPTNKQETVVPKEQLLREAEELNPLDYVREQARRRARNLQNRRKYETYVKEKGAVRTTGKVFQVLDSGLLLADVTLAERVLSGWDDPEWLESSRLVFVYTDPRPYADGDNFTGQVYPCGHFEYRTVLGAGKKVNAYAVDPKLARQLSSETQGRSADRH